MPINQINFKLLFLVLFLVIALVGFCFYSNYKIDSSKRELQHNLDKIDALKLQLKELQENYNITDGKKEALEEYLTSKSIINREEKKYTT